MKKILGAIAAALVLGAGCAHNQEKTAQTEPQSSVENTGQVQTGGTGNTGTLAGMECEVIGFGGSGAASAEQKPSECVEQQTSADATGIGAASGSASEDVAIDSTVPAEDDLAIGGSAPAEEDLAIGGSASEDIATDDSASKDLAKGNTAADDDVNFEDTDMGGTGGGGG
jgi:hypothetical protein